MKRLLPLLILTSSISMLNAEDLQERITRDDAPLINKAYHSIKNKWLMTENEISVSAGAWYVMWEQTSTSNELVSSTDALNIDYNIDPSTAAMLTLKANYRLISAQVQYYSTGVSVDDNQEMSGLSLGLSVTDLIPNLNTEFRLNSADFKGSIKATNKLDGLESGLTPSSGTFETQLNIYDFIVYPFNKYVGFGYRKYDYDFPQDLYLVKKSDNSVLTKGLANIKYSGDFVTLVVDNKRLREYGFIYSAVLGMGELTPSSKGFDTYLEKSDAKMAELFLGYSSITSNQGIKFSYALGYRYNRIETEANPSTSADFTLMTEFNTEFHGPYAQLTFIY